MTSLYLGKYPTEGIDSTTYEELANTCSTKKTSFCSPLLRQSNGVIKLIVQYTTGNSFNLGMSRGNLAIECLRSAGFVIFQQTYLHDERHDTGLDAVV